HIRKLYQVLRQGSFVTLLTGDTQQQNTAPSTYAFARTMQGQDAVVVALNNGPASNQASIPVAGIYTDGTSLYDVLGSGSYTVGSGAVQVTLPARTGVLLVRGPIGNNSPSVGAGITLSPGLNGSGWSNSPVTVELRGNDSGSGIEQLRYWIDDGPVNVAEGNSAALPIAAEGSYVVGLRAIDNAGYVSRQATQIVRIDLQAPAVAVTGVQPGATYSGNAPAAGCTTIDALSGVATKASVSISGGNGRFTATCSGGKDNAGNVAQPVSVTYFVVGSTNH
ncbi:MAG TPA: alpha amylase C-terminal domain-containing protein, partial [Terriglobales bacterium]